MSITINGTTGIAGVDGSAATPSVQGADANTGVFFPAADTVALTTGGTERMRVDSSGNVGIGTSSPGSVLDVVGTSATDIFHVRNGTTYFTVGVTSGGASAVNAFQTSVGAQQLQFQTAGGTSYFGGNVGIGTSSPQAKLDIGDTSAAFTASIIRASTTGIAELRFADTVDNAGYVSYDHTSNYMRLATSATERMRIDASGQVLFGLTSSIGTGVAQFRGGIRGDNSSGDANFAIESRSGGTLYSSSIYNSTTAAGASVSITGTAGFLQRSTSSIKYKTDVEDLDQSLSANIYQMRPVWYRSKCEMDRKDWSYLGLIAEEVAEIEPRLVHWGEVKEDGTQEPEGVMYDRLTVLLLAEVKKQQAIITALEARIAALEAK